jgi:hypothetical protein
MEIKKAIHIFLHPYASHITGEDITNARECIINNFEKYVKLTKETKIPPDPNLSMILRTFLKLEKED